MHIKVMKWVSIAALLLAVAFWSSAANYQPELNLVVSIAAVVVLVEAFQRRKYRWAAGFLTIALLFNPLLPPFHLAGKFALLIVVLSIASFAMALVLLKPRRLMLVPSITDRNPGSRSL